MPKCRNAPSQLLHAFHDFRVFNAKAPGSLSSEVLVCRISKYQNFETPHLIILFVIRELEWPRVLACTPDLRTLNPQNDLTAQTDHDQWPTLILNTKVMGSSTLIHLAISIDPTVLAISGVLLGEFRPFNFFPKNLWPKSTSVVLLWDLTFAQ
jgi:hypothetical protein